MCWGYGEGVECVGVMVGVWYGLELRWGCGMCWGYCGGVECPCSTGGRTVDVSVHSVQLID